MFEMRKSSQKSHERKDSDKGLSVIANSHVLRNVLKRGNLGLYSKKADVYYPDMSPIGDSPDDSSEYRIIGARGCIRGRVM